MVKNKIIANFTGVTVFILLSKLLGFVRNIYVASSIGTSTTADIYNQVFRFVPLFMSVGMALSLVNIPNLTYYLSNRSEDERGKYVSNLFAQIFLFGMLISIAGIVSAPVVARLILPGLEQEWASVSVMLTRIMFPAFLFVNLAYITAGTLQVHKHFIMSSIISIPFNIIIIISVLVWKGNIVALGYATTIGWMLQFMVQLPTLMKEKYKFNFNINMKNEHIKAMYRQLIPIMLANSVFSLCMLVNNGFASKLDEGTVSALTFGSDLFTIIASTFIVAMSTVTFPDLSKYCMEKDYDKVKKLVAYMFKILLFILMPYLIVVIFYNYDIIKLVYERGEFTQRSTGMASAAFLIYSFCIAGYVSMEIFNRLYYALKKYRIPMIVSIISVCMNYGLVFAAYGFLGIQGVAGATAITFIIYAVIMNILVQKEIGSFLDRDFAKYVVKAGIPAAAMTAVFSVFKLLNFTGIVMGFFLPVVVGGLIYLAVSYVTGALKETILRRV